MTHFINASGFLFHPLILRFHSLHFGHLNLVNFSVYILLFTLYLTMSNSYYDGGYNKRGGGGGGGGRNSAGDAS